MTKVLEDTLGNLEYLMIALTLIGVIYLCYKRSGLKINLSYKTSPQLTDKPIHIKPQSMPSQSLPTTAVAVKPGMPPVSENNIKNWNKYCRPTYDDHLDAKIAAQTADSPFDDLRLSSTTYEVPTIVQEPIMSSDGHIIDNVEGFRPHMKRV